MLDSFEVTCAAGVEAIERRLAPARRDADRTDEAAERLATAAKPHLGVLNPLVPIVQDILKQPN